MTPLEWQERAVREVGGQSRNAVYELRLPFGVSGGHYTPSVSGDATAPLPFDAPAATLEAALCALPGVGLGGAFVSGPRKGPFQIEIVGANAGQPLPEGWLSGDGSALVPPATLVPIRVQSPSVNPLGALANTAWLQLTPLFSPYECFLRVKRELLTGLLAGAAHEVDGKDGDAESKDSQRFANLRALLSQVQDELNLIIRNRGGAGQTTAGVIAKGTAIVADAEIARHPYGYGPLVHDNGWYR